MEISLEHYNAMAERISYLEQKLSDREWIPVSERPPEEKKVYLIQTDDGYMCNCRWTNRNHLLTDLTTDWHWHIMDVPQYSKVVAWMPLLEPYREEKKSDCIKND